MEYEVNISGNCLKIYRPENYDNPIAPNASIGVKFSNNTFIHHTAFKIFGIVIGDNVKLDESFMGKGIYKFDDKGNISENWKIYIEKEYPEGRSIGNYT